MFTTSTKIIQTAKYAFLLGLAATTLCASAQRASSAGYTVQQISSPGPAMRMSSNHENVTGFYVAKCVTLSSQPKRTICYNAPFVITRLGTTTDVLISSAEVGRATPMQNRSLSTMRAN